MKRRNQRTAVILLFSILMGMIFQGIPYAEPKAQVSSESYHFTEGEAVEPYSVDLSGVNTVTTGRALVIDGVDIFPQISDLKYYSSVNVSYELTFKDESRMEEELAKEEKKRREESGDDTISLGRDSWLLNTVVLTLYVKDDFGGRDNFASEGTKSITKGIIPLNRERINESVTEYELEFDLSDYCFGGSWWPVGVESAQITSITFIPYENVIYGEPVVTPTATPNPENNLSQPQPPAPTDKDESYKSGQVENFSVNLERYQTSFSKSWIYFDLQDAYGANWFYPQNYSAVRIRYRIEYFEEEEQPENCEANEWYLHCIKYALIAEPHKVDGFSESAGIPSDFINRPSIGTENTLLIDYKAWKEYAGLEKEQPIAGINIQPMNKYFRWPMEIKSFTVTGIEFLAKEGAVYPSAPATIVPTSTPTVTAMPSLTPEPIEYKVEKIANLQTKVHNKKKIRVSWTPIKEADGYEIFRSTKKNNGYQKIAVQAWNKDTYTDSKIKRGQDYFYRVRAYEQHGISRVYGEFSACKKQMVRRKSPSYTLKKGKTSQGTSYVQIRLKSWSDPYLEIWVRWGKKNYMKIPLSHNKISKKKRTYFFKYSPGKRKMWFQIKTYRKSKGKKLYSYTTTKRI